MADFQSMLRLEQACRDDLKSKSSSPSSHSILRKFVLKFKPSIKQIQKLIIIATRCNNENAIFDILTASWSYISLPGRNERNNSYEISGSSNTSIIKEEETIDNIFTLKSENGSGDTLLHLMCKEFGWNPCVLLVVEFSIFVSRAMYKSSKGSKNIRNNSDYLFIFNSERETPLQLSCEYGCSPSEIMSSLIHLFERQNKFESIFSNKGSITKPDLTLSFLFSNDQNQLHFIKLIAQFTDNDLHEINVLLSIMMKVNPMILSVIHNSNVEKVDDLSNDDTTCVGLGGGCLAIHWACYYQNPSLIKFCLLHSPFEFGGLGIPITSTKVMKQRKSSSSVSLLPLRTPLDYILMNLGANDDQYTWQCLDSCVNATSNSILMKLIVEKTQCQSIRKVLLGKNVLNQIIKRYHINILAPFIVGAQDTGSSNYQSQPYDNETILTSAIRQGEKWTIHDGCDHGYNEHCLLYDFCQFISKHSANDEYHKNALEQLASFPLTRQISKHKRLPLHIALEYNIHWNDGLQLLLYANISALEEIDPLTNLAPFMLAASTLTSRSKKKTKKRNNIDLNVIFQLLRYQPTMIMQQINTKSHFFSSCLINTD